MGGLAWIAPGLMLMVAFRCSGGQTFRLGYVAGLTHYLVSLYWLLNIPVTFGPIVGWVALAAYLALYPAVWVWLCWKIADLNIERPTSNSERPMGTARTLRGWMFDVRCSMFPLRTDRELRSRVPTRG